MADLITYDELIASLRLSAGDIDAQQEADLRRVISAASAAVSRYADRDFGVPNVTEERVYEYDGSGLLEVDDFTAATAVVLSSYGIDSPLDATEWRAQPYGALAQSYFLLPAYIGGGSAEMGFTRNLDRVVAERGWVGSVLVKVTATWGWPVVPDDVKQAVIWTAAEAQEDPGSKRSEAIANYSYSRDTPGLPEQTAIPQRAIDLLTPYIRLKVG